MMGKWIFVLAAALSFNSFATDKTAERKPTNFTSMFDYLSQIQKELKSPACIVSQTLEKAGYTVVLECDGQDAIISAMAGEKYSESQLIGALIKSKFHLVTVLEDKVDETRIHKQFYFTK